MNEPEQENLPRWRGASTAIWLALLSLALAGATWLVQLWFLGGRDGLPLDDSWIHLDFARSMAEGLGLSYNPGHLVSASTAPLWSALLSVAFFLPGSPVFWSKLFGVLLYAAGVILTYRLARELGATPIGSILGGVLAAVSAPLVWSALSGMEVPLFIVLSIGGMILHLRERRALRARLASATDRPRSAIEPVPLSLLVLGLAVLARPEGYLLLILAFVDRLLVGERAAGGLRLRWLGGRNLLGGVFLTLVALAPTAIFYTVIGGSPFPTTLFAKAGGGWHLWPRGLYLYTVLGIFVRPQPVVTLFFAAGALLLLRRLGTERDAGLLPVLWVVTLPMAYSLASPLGRQLLVGNFGRYFFPLLPPLIAVAMLAIDEVLAALGRRWRFGRVVVPMRALAVVAILIPTMVILAKGVGRYAQNVANINDGDVRLMTWLHDRLDPRALVAVEDAGIARYVLPNPMIDLGGLMTPEIVPMIKTAMSSRDPFGARGVRRFLVERRPDFLIAFPRWFPSLTRDRALLRPVARLAIRNNITLAGDELVVYEFPWTRYPLSSSPQGSGPRILPPGRH